LTGYGAYNLCFDKLLGRKTNNPSDPNFFATIFNNGFRKINLVKVICFRWSQNEFLPPDRARPLYKQGAVNQEFLDNLVDLVTSAAQYHFWVQVCIFHQQALSIPDGDPNDPHKRQEMPENLPPALMPRGADGCERLRNFFNPRPSNPTQLTLQKELVGAIVDRLSGFTNVLYEIGNELRMDGGNCSIADNCALAEWLNIMGRQLTNVLGQTNSIGTSTGCYSKPPTAACNEISIFNSNPAQAAPCPQVFSPGFFDFHFGQWYKENDLAGGMSAAKQRADAYKGRATPLIINDDGAKAQRTPDNVELWAKTAYSLGAGGVPLHYASKQPYPNGGRDTTGRLFDFDTNVLTRMNRAAAI
jgi:hypothetical protein